MYKEDATELYRGICQTGNSNVAALMDSRLRIMKQGSFSKSC